jgi:hypothetical protein
MTSHTRNAHVAWQDLEESVVDVNVLSVLEHVHCKLLSASKYSQRGSLTIFHGPSIGLES